MKAKSGFKYAIALGLALGAWYGGNKLYVQYVILPKVMPLLVPGKVNLLGIKLEGERIVISNGTARLLQGSGAEFGAGDDPEAMSEDSGAAEEGGGTPVPLSAVVGALRQDPVAAGDLVAAFASVDTDTIPPAELVWEQEGVERALAGDPQLQSKLEDDVCQGLDGKLLAKFRKSRIRSGIYIRLHPKLQVHTQQGLAEVDAPVVVGFKTPLVERMLSNSQIRGKFDPTEAAWKGVYAEEGGKLASDARSNPRAALEKAISKSRLGELAKAANQLLARVTVLATEGEMGSSELEVKPKPGGKGEIGTVRLEVSDDSRIRMWQYTYRHPRCQLLFVYDGIGVAAPFVKSEMKYSTVTITNVTDTATAQEAVDAINTKRK